MYFILHVWLPLWRENGSYIAVHITHWSGSRRTPNYILLPHLDSQLGGPEARTYIPKERGDVMIPPGTAFSLSLGFKSKSSRSDCSVIRPPQPPLNDTLLALKVSFPADLTFLRTQSKQRTPWDVVCLAGAWQRLVAGVTFRILSNCVTVFTALFAVTLPSSFLFHSYGDVIGSYWRLECHKLKLSSSFYSGRISF
jgi:hypothetical protein